MARTRSTPRVPRLAYAQLQRSPADVAACVPPTHRQFDLALDNRDADTVLAYLQLNPKALEALEPSNANLSFPQSQARDPSKSDNEEDTWIMYPSWFIPATSPLGVHHHVSLFEEMAIEGWNEIVEWFFASRDHVARWGMLLVKSQEGMIFLAACHNRICVVEILSSSSAFAEFLDPAEQQRASQ